MPSITVKDQESFEVAMRRFKRVIDRSNRIGDIRNLKYHEKPTALRKRKKIAAVKRERRKMRMQRMMFRPQRIR